MSLRRVLAVLLLVGAWLYLGYLVWTGNPPIFAFMIALGFSLVAGLLWGPNPPRG